MLKGFEQQLAARERLDFYVLKKGEASAIVDDAQTIISTNAGSAAAQAVGERITVWQQSLIDIRSTGLDPSEAQDLRALRVDVLEARAQLVDYAQSLP